MSLNDYGYAIREYAADLALKKAKESVSLELQQLMETPDYDIDRCYKYNILWKTKVYLVGQMQYGDGKNWRNVIKEALKGRGINFLDPYHKPFIHDVPEDNESREEMKRWMEKEQYELITARGRAVRGLDLRCVDLSDWLIFYVDAKFHTAGSYEEFYLANRQKKPIFVISEGGKKKCPLWVHWTIPHHYIYDNIEDAIKMIKNIDDGNIPINSDRWKLLKPEYR